MWPDRRLLDLFKTEFPFVLAPMAGIMDADLVIAAAQGGALGSLPCAMISVEKAREQINIIRQRVSAPVNMNFFCHNAVDAAMCELVEELKPEVVSFHFGLPDPALLRRVKAAGCIVISSATIVREAIWLEENGADAIIAEGGIADGRGIAAAFALGAAGVQIGSAYLRCPESKVIAPARVALAQARDDSTVITNVMTGRPARGVANRVMREVGPISL